MSARDSPRVTTEPPLRAEALHDLRREFDAELLKALYRDVLAPAFEPDELETMEALIPRLQGERKPDAFAMVLCDDDGSVLAGLVAELDRDRVMLLSYLAVRDDLRGRGIGGFLLDRVARSWYEDKGVLLALGEVHDPRVWSSQEGEAARRRLRLYERHGAELLDMPFVQPALRPDAHRVPGFLVLAFHVDPSILMRSGDRSGVPAGLLSWFVRRYYASAEGVREPDDDPQLSAILTAIERDDVVELIPVMEYERVPQLSL